MSTLCVFRFQTWINPFSDLAVERDAFSVSTAWRWSESDLFPSLLLFGWFSKLKLYAQVTHPSCTIMNAAVYPRNYFVKIIHLHWTRNNHMTLSITRNPGVFTQRKEGGYRVLGLHRKNAECGLEHWYLWAQTVDPEVAEPSEQWPGGWEADTHNTETTLNIFWAGHLLLLFPLWIFIIEHSFYLPPSWGWSISSEGGLRKQVSNLLFAAFLSQQGAELATHTHLLHICKSQIGHLLSLCSREELQNTRNLTPIIWVGKQFIILL